MIEVSGEFLVRHDGSGDDLSDHLDDVMGSLVDMPRVLDAAIDADLAESRVVITVTWDGGSVEDDAHAAVAAIRAAIHAAGGGTAGWDERFEMVRSDAEMIPA